MSDELPPLFYFGCIRVPGHYLWRTERDKIYDFRKAGISAELHSALDGAFCPDGIKTYPRYRWLCSIVPPWTIIAWWDGSVDSRPNCCSVFIGLGGFGILRRHHMLEAARLRFPSVFARQPQPLEEFTA